MGYPRSSSVPVLPLISRRAEPIRTDWCPGRTNTAGEPTGGPSRCGSPAARPYRVGYLLLARSTVENVMRYRMPRPSHLNQSTSIWDRRPIPGRYRHQHPCDLVCMNTSKSRLHPGIAANRRPGYAYLHRTVDGRPPLWFTPRSLRCKTAAAYKHHGC